jgi:hypothetical protein
LTNIETTHFDSRDRDRRRRSMIGMVAVTIAVGLCAALPAGASAFTAGWTCGALPPSFGFPPLIDCRATSAGYGLHSYDYSRAYYPGPPAHNVSSCTYLWNNRTQRVRTGQGYCGNNDSGYVYYGVTTQTDYDARTYQGSGCCNHTVNGAAIA